ncbi:carbohydrate ABC transporter permease [Frondihabitans australicus]|uniref:Multiple sugar transport system permease protein n=1 Tax=Frondihabitans australicus TaxID=386892 RepID=A0A495IEN7_9MICO|nr:carbohydrate ABC transporter permease [Frondihabitans australicus]RKR74452.1 multiple sugar transport system permease protein [Frondihabitans australicus]
MSAVTSEKVGAPGRGASSATGRASRRRSKGRAGSRKSPLLTVILWVIAAYFLLPLIWLVISSTKDNGDLFSTFGYWFGKFNLVANVESLSTYQGGIFWHWLINTVVYSVTSAVLAAFFATAAGYAFAKYVFPGSKALFYSVLGAIMIPTTALAIPTFLLFSSAGLTDTPFAVVLPSLVSPFGVFLMSVYAADAVDTSLMEAARIDGAGEFRIFFQVALRLLGPGIVTVLLFALVATWNNYFLPLIMLNTQTLFPLTVGLSQWEAASSSGGGGSQALFSSVITGSLISILPLVIAFLYLQRFWQSGLATGGVKG